MSHRKPQPGACGVCGCAVVRPTQVDAAIASGEMQYGGSWDNPINESGWASGHQFDENGKLVKVRCQVHGGLGFPPASPPPNATVLM